MAQTPSFKDLLPAGREQWTVYLCCLLVFAGFSCSRLLISLGLIGLIVAGLVNSDIRVTWARYRGRPSFYINVLFFVVILLSGINSDNKTQWLTFLQIKIPFLLLPVAFCGYTFFDRAFFNKLLFAFVCCMTVSATAVMINYWLHYDDINAKILTGGIVPVPYSHIRYTLLLVFAFFSLLWLWEQRFVRWRGILLVPALFLLITIHLLLSRSGWLALYAGLLYCFFVFVWRSRRYLVGAIILAGIVALPFLLYHFVPSLQNKIGYIRYTFGEYKDGHIDNFSDAMRIASWQTGTEIIRRHPWTGIGVGDLPAASKEISKELFPSIRNDDDRKLPHNEFIWIWAATGIFGLLAYCAAFFYPFIANARQHNWLFVVLFIVFFTSFLSEYSLEEQIGSTFYLLFLLIFLAHFTYSPAAND